MGFEQVHKADLENRQMDKPNVTVEQFKNKLDKLAAGMESLEYDFYDTKNEEAALNAIVIMIHCLNELEGVVERDDAYKQLKKDR